MNDINYFLTEEEKFCNEHPTYGDFFFNEKYNGMDFVGSEDPMFFITERPFSKYYSLMKEASDGEIKYPLTAIEHVVLMLFVVVRLYGKVIISPFFILHLSYILQNLYKNVYIIYPLKNGKTKAHNLFEIICHGKENQVEFLRNTSFEVTNVLETVGTEYKKFYLQEI